MTRPAAGLALVGIVVLASCGAGQLPGSPTAGGGAVSEPVSSTGAGSETVGLGWLATGTGAVDFVQWTATGGLLSGSAQTVTVKGQPPDQSVVNATVSVSGSRQGSTLSVSFDGGAASFGTISGASFTLNVPQPGGTLAPVTFRQVATSVFNGDVVELNASVSEANQRAAVLQAQAAQQAADARAEQAAEQKADGDVAAVNSAGEALVGQESGLSSEVKAIATGSLAGVAKDLAEVGAGDQRVVAEAEQYPGGDYGIVCNDASVVANDANVVANDANVVANAANVVADAVSSLRSSATGLGRAFGQLQSDLAAVPSYLPANLPTASQVSTAVGAATSAASSAVAATNDYIDQANAGVAAAVRYAADAAQAGNCAGVPSAPSPQSHIS